MSYEIRDVDKALKKMLVDRNFNLVMEGKDVRVRVLFGSPDEIYAKFRLPCICIESGYLITVPEKWQPDEVKSIDINATDSKYVDKTTCRLIDIFYSYKIGFYVTKKPHCTYMEMEFLKMFPNYFNINVINSDGDVESVYFIADQALVNLDQQKSIVTRDRSMLDTEMDSDTRIYRRDKMVTAQLLIEESSVETLLRPYGGIEYGVAFSVPAEAAAATLTQATITFVEE
jgi:hypothetical protein